MEGSREHESGTAYDTGKVLSELPGYLGWMIGSCRFSFGKEAGGNTPGQMQYSCDLTVLRSDARLAEVEIRNLTTEDQLRVMLVNAASGTETDQEKQQESSIWISGCHHRGKRAEHFL